jgi:hypothetical protein
MAELVYQGVVQAEMGDLDGARATRARIALDSPLIAAELSVIAGAMELVAWIGDVEGARYLRRFLPRFAGRQVTTGRVGMMLVSPPERLEALLAHAQGDSRRALELIAGAIAAAERMGLPPIALRLLLDRARIQAAIGEPVAIDALVAEAARLGMPRVAAAAGALRREEPAFTLSRDGDVWRIARGPRSFLVKDSRGLGMLAALVAQPDREIHAIDLAHGPDVVDGGDAGELLDADAKAAYRRRLHELAEAREEAAGDPARLVQIEDEVDAIDRELRRAVGLGGRDRRAGAAAERARVNVQRRLRDALARIAEHDAELARHLEASLRTGTYCVYRSRPPG